MKRNFFITMDLELFRNNAIGSATEVDQQTSKLGNVLVDGEYPHYDTPVVADFNDLQYKMNVLARKWCAEHYPDALLLIYEFQGWYRQQNPDDGAATIILDSEHGDPKHCPCRGAFTALHHYEKGYINMPTLFVYFSNSNLDSIYVEAIDSPFIESNYAGDFPPNGAYLALQALRNYKKDADFFTEGYITYRIGVLPPYAEPVYQFGSYFTDEYHSVGVNTMRIDVPAGYDMTIPHEPWPGIDDKDDKNDEAPQPKKYDPRDKNHDGVVDYKEFHNQ